MKVLYLLSWCVLMIMGMPIAFSLGAICFAFFWIDGGTMTSVPQRMFAAVDSFPLLAVPAFILAGEVMNTGGLTKRIVEFARVLVGHISGGLGHVTVLANVIVSGISGSALAEAAGIGSVMIEAMKKQGFSPAFAGSLNAAASTIGPLIPPSIPLVIYAVMASVSAGKMLLAGFAPGFLVAIALMVYVYFVSKKRGYPTSERATLNQVWQATKSAFLALMTPIIIIWGIVGGVFTPTEAAAATVVYGLVVSLFVYKDMHWRDLPSVFRKSAKTTAVVGFIISTANLVSYVLTRERVPQMMSETLLSLSDERWVILLLINILLLVLGCFMEGLAVMLLTVPVLLPLVMQLGVDPVHFGVIVVMNLMIGLIHPPFGMALFVVAKVGDIPYKDLAWSIWPFVIPLLIVLLICTYWPWIVMVLPNLMLGR
ncbi:TRAP transporter large permease [Limnohabitans sp. Rim8]|uniref:TRAP transporter large permease n=1 Tax=Limnohabitans sp. Rim8 TaxID=1100718 RepID=UPI00261E290B|nr:TRAP transporter large permease [Limnohabitans sp. Rim8]